VNTPVPDIPADGGMVKVEIGGVCGSDFKHLHGGKNGLPYPLILGHEILGRVEKLGKGAAASHGIKEGDRIIMKGAKAAAAAPTAPCRRKSMYARPCISGGLSDMSLARQKKCRHRRRTFSIDGHAETF
jgi:D-arabinose 1-dehydrogenase-like Zn-dependent alcohol dehydrogenase